MTRKTTVTEITSVWCAGSARHGEPTLRDLRLFVGECEGLSDDLVVGVSVGQVTEGGKRSHSLRVDLRKEVTA